MGNQIFKIKLKTLAENSLYIPKHIYSNNSCNLSFGSASTNCKVKFHTENNDCIYISSDLWKQLFIPFEGDFQIFIKDDAIHIGPLIGIFTAGFTGSILRPVGTRSLFFAKLLEVVSSLHSFAFVFGPHHINWKDATITGLFFRKNGWEKITVPFPNVVYNRLPNRKVENLDIFKEIKLKLSNEYLIPCFNPNFFSKEETFRIFSGNEATKKYLPDTLSSPTKSDIKSYLEKYNHIYLKPSNGSLANGIYQIFKQKGTNKFSCRYRDGDSNKHKSFSTIEEITDQILDQKSLKNYILQQGISLIKNNERPIDFRIHTNKNEENEWVVSAIAIKAAGPGSVTTHIRSGGIVKTLSEVFRDSKEEGRIMHKIREATLALSKELEKNVTGFIGEIGFDLGLDYKGNIWLFEANSKPGRSIFMHPELKEDDWESRKLPMSYATYLAKKSILNPEGLFHEDLLSPQG